MLVASAVQDAGRNGASLRMAVTPAVTGYVRMLNPPSCSRCVVLAGVKYPKMGGRVFRMDRDGKWVPEYSATGAFERHPMCDCIPIPVNEDTAGDLATNPYAYFDSLSREEQDRTFTKAGAEAIRDGADIHKVVNARRGGGVRKAQILGRELWTTLEGTSKSGQFRRRQYRLMPESIYAIATDRADALRLLKVYGYVL
jgi:hypothetical protein